MTTLDDLHALLAAASTSSDIDMRVLYLARARATFTKLDESMGIAKRGLEGLELEAAKVVSIAAERERCGK